MTNEQRIEQNEKQKNFVCIRLSDGLVVPWIAQLAKQSNEFRVVSRAVLEQTQAKELVGITDPEVSVVTLNLGTPEPKEEVVVPAAQDDHLKAMEAQVSETLAALKTKAELIKFAKDKFGVDFPDYTVRPVLEESIRKLFLGTYAPKEV